MAPNPTHAKRQIRKLPFRLSDYEALQIIHIHLEHIMRRENRHVNAHLVDLDTGNDFLVYEDIDHLLSVGGGLVQGLFEKNGSGDVLAESGGLNQQLAVRLSVGLSVLEADGRQSKAASGVRLVHGEDTTSGRSDRFLHESNPLPGT